MRGSQDDLPDARQEPVAAGLPEFAGVEIRFVSPLDGQIVAPGDSVDVAVDYIGNINDQGELSSMHGPDEVTGDIIQLCVNQVAHPRLLEFMHCQSRNYRELTQLVAPNSYEDSLNRLYYMVDTFARSGAQYQLLYVKRENKRVVAEVAYAWPNRKLVVPVFWVVEKFPGGWKVNVNQTEAIRQRYGM